MSNTQQLHYIFIAGDIRTTDGTIPARQAIVERLNQGYWALPENASHRKLLKPDDKVIFYAAGKYNGGVFVANALLATDATARSPNLRKSMEYKYDFLLATPYGVELKDVSIFTHGVAAKNLLEELSFTKPIPKWGVYFRGAVARITPQDYSLILNRAIEASNQSDISKSD